MAEALADLGAGEVRLLASMGAAVLLESIRPEAVVTGGSAMPVQVVTVGNRAEADWHAGTRCASVAVSGAKLEGRAGE